MTLPLYTTQVKVERDPNTEERWAERNYTTVAESWPAVIGGPNATDNDSAQSSDQSVEAVLYLDNGRATQRLDRVTDLSTGQVYQVVAILERTALELDHHRAGLRTLGEL